MPLKIGNKWAYKTWDTKNQVFLDDSKANFEMEVVDKINMFNKSFFKVLTTYFRSDTLFAKSTQYYYTHLDTLFYLQLKDNSTEKDIQVAAIFKTNAKFTGIFDNHTYEISSRNATDSTLNIVHYIQRFADSGSEAIYKKGIGQIESFSYQTPYHSVLVDYTLN